MLVSLQSHVKRNLELEAAIVAKPHDRAVYLVYADWLTEQGDPRGELIRLGAERVPRDPPKYTEHMERMQALRDAHLASWLGDLAGKALHRLQFSWSLGFFFSASVRPPSNASDARSKDVVAAVLACPLALVLKELTIHGSVREIVDATPTVLPATIESLQLFYDPRYEGSERELDSLREKFTKHRRTVNIKPYVPPASAAPRPQQARPSSPPCQRVHQVNRLYMRTSAEAHMYMDQRPCTCGDIEFDRQSAVMTDGGVLCSRYFGKCRTCGTIREFIFELPPAQRPITNQVEFGGPDPSRLLDAGEWMAIAQCYAKLQPGTRDDLDVARAAVEEVVKFLPGGADSVPDTAFWTERGRAVRDREPARFRRARLAAILDVYRKLEPKSRATSAAATRLRRSFVPADVRAQFLAVLHDTDLPDPLPLGRTVNIYYEVPECLDEERSARGIYQVRAGYDGTYYLDCYYETVALALFSSHYRLRPDGSKEELESLQTGGAEDAERVAEHNARVRKILQAKGFG